MIQQGAGVRIAVDIGGTFTDILAQEPDGRLRRHKVPTTPDAIESAIVQGLDDLGIESAKIEHFSHGTTTGINALLERRGGTTGLITTHGFRDVLEIGRTNRPRMYDLQYEKPCPLIPRRMRHEVVERMLPTGEVLVPLDEDDVARQIRDLVKLGVESIAVCLLFGYVNPVHERCIADIARRIAPEIDISLSSDVVREWREFERTSTTAANAFIRRPMTRYLDRLEQVLTDRGTRTPVQIMTTSGGTSTANLVRDLPVKTVFSGPSGGVRAGETIAEVTGLRNLVTLDVGGTSSDFCLVVDGRATYSGLREVAGLPILAESPDIHTIGAGGGTIAHVDAGALFVGPLSAGSVPGPACYGRGGVEPTVTDAQVTLGRLAPDGMLDGKMHLDRERSDEALNRYVARPLGLELPEAAGGVLRVVETAMAHAVRTLALQVGEDPRDFYIVAFGGAGGFHAVPVAQEIEAKGVIVPYHAGMLSAWGILTAEERIDDVRTINRVLQPGATGDLRRTVDTMLGEMRETASFDVVEATTEIAFDMRYQKQTHTIRVSIPRNLIDHHTALAEAFSQQHERINGFVFDSDDIVVDSVRVTVTRAGHPAPLSDAAEKTAARAHGNGTRQVWFPEVGFVETDLHRRSELMAGTQLSGPAVVEDEFCNVVVPPTAEARVDEHLNLIITLMPKGQ